MPVVTKYAVTGQAAGGAFNGAWTNPTNVGSDNGVYATAAPGKNQEYASVFPIAFSTAEVPAGATINSVLVEMQVKASTTSSVGLAHSSLFADSAQSTPLSAVPGVSTPTTEPTVDTTFSYAGTPTEAQIRDLWVRVQATRGNSNTALTWSLDFVRVTVNYTDPPAGHTGSGAGSQATASGSGTGVERFVASGAGGQAVPSASGSGALGFKGLGAGVQAAPSGSGTGTATETFTGSGAGAQIVASGSGSGTLRFIASGAGAGATPAGGGTGTERFIGIGAGGQPAASSSGSGSIRFLIEGAGTQAAPSGSGFGTTGDVIAGSGAGLGAASSGAGTALLRFIGSGAGESQSASGSGTGTIAVDIIGDGAGLQAAPSGAGTGTNGSTPPRPHNTPIVGPSSKGWVGGVVEDYRP